MHFHRRIHALRRPQVAQPARVSSDAQDEHDAAAGAEGGGEEVGALAGVRAELDGEGVGEGGFSRGRR